MTCGGFKGAKWMDGWFKRDEQKGGKKEERKEGRKDVNTSVVYVAPGYTEHFK